MCRHKEHRPGSLRAEAEAKRKIREIGFQIRGIRDEAVARFLVIQPVKQPSVERCMHWLTGGPRTRTFRGLARISQGMSISPALVRRVGRARNGPSTNSNPSPYFHAIHGHREGERG